MFVNEQRVAFIFDSYFHSTGIPITSQNCNDFNIITGQIKFNKATCYIFIC